VFVSDFPGFISSCKMDKIYSRHAVLESLRANRRKFHRLLVADGVKDAPVIREIVNLAGKRGLAVSAIRRELLDENAQGVTLEASAFPLCDLSDILAKAQSKNEPPLILMLDAVQDVHNFGNLIRTAEAVGAHGLVIGQHRSVGVTPAVVNASSGAVEHMLVAQVVNLARAVDELKQAEVWVAALAGDDPRAQEIYRVNLKGALALIVGSEGEGVSRLLRDKSDFVLRLPMRGQVASLNASVAGAVAIYEALRQRG